MDSHSDSGSSVSRLSRCAPRSHATTFDGSNSDQDTPKAADTDTTSLIHRAELLKLSHVPHNSEFSTVQPSEDTAAPVAEASRVGVGHLESAHHIDIAQEAARKATPISQAGHDAQSDAEPEGSHPRPDTDARSDTFSDAHPRGTTSLTPAAPQRDPVPQPFSLCEVTDRALQEFMLSHDSTDFTHSMQVRSLFVLCSQGWCWHTRSRPLSEQAVLGHT